MYTLHNDVYVCMQAWRCMCALYTSEHKNVDHYGITIMIYTIKKHRHPPTTLYIFWSVWMLGVLEPCAHHLMKEFYSAYLHKFSLQCSLCIYICRCKIVELVWENAPIVAESTGTEAAREYFEKYTQLHLLLGFY